MEWEQILIKIRVLKDSFDKSYKCLNIDRPTKDDTIDKHFQNLIECSEGIRAIVSKHYEKFTPQHKVAADAFYIDVKDKLLRIAEKKGLDIELPVSIHEKIIYKNIKVVDKIDIMAAFSLDTASKALPLFNGNYLDLEAFIITANLINRSLADTAKTDFLEYIYHAKLTSQVRTAIGSYEKPANFERLVELLRERYKSRETIRELQNKLNTSFQGKMSIDRLV